MNATESAPSTSSGSTWYYTYDGNGSLIQADPGTEVSNGSTRYSYNTAKYLTKVEKHNGIEWQTQSEMSYDGLGNRLEVTTYTDGEGSTTRYVLDNGSTLIEMGTDNNTYYLNGKGIIGTLGESWRYLLSDGAGSTRQLVDEDGTVSLSVSYTPWGSTMDVYGSGSLSLATMGGVYDAGTGLIYMGNGQYYDPSTGRFLTRGVQAGQTNPYTPWNGDPAGMLMAPLILLGLLFGRKKTHTKFDHFLILFVIVLSVGLTALMITEVPVVMAYPIEDDPEDPYHPQPIEFPTADSTTADAEPATEENTKSLPELYPRENLYEETMCVYDFTRLYEKGPDPAEGELWNVNGPGRLYTIYERMYNGYTGHPKYDFWWWEVFGCDGHFSLKEFYSVLMIREFTDISEPTDPTKYPNLDPNIYVEALGRRGAIWCTTDAFSKGVGNKKVCDPTTTDGTAYFLYNWSRPIQTFANGPCANNNFPNDKCNLEVLMPNNWSDPTDWPAKIVDAIMNPDPDYYNIRNDRPIDTAVAQDPSDAKAVKDYLWDHYEHRPFYVGGGTEPLVILTFCENMVQYRNWDKFYYEHCTFDLPHQGEEIKQMELFLDVIRDILNN